MEARRARLDYIADAIRWSLLSLGWALAVGGASLAAGLAAHSTALVGFGLDSLVDGAASATLVWRFRHERLGTRVSDEVERKAARIFGFALLLIAVYLAIRASIALAQESGPESSVAGIVLTSTSVLILPVFARAKLHLARQLDSPALRADGVLSAAGGALAGATLLALAANALLGWWWADSVAALLIAGTLLREGRLTRRAARGMGS